jgi:hypothetical protein
MFFLKKQSSMHALTGKYYERLDGTTDNNCIQNKNVPVWGPLKWIL